MKFIDMFAGVGGIRLGMEQAGHSCVGWVEWDVLDSAEVVPQHRERIFIIGHLRGASTRKVFPIERENKSTSETNEIVRLFNGRQEGTYGSQDILSPDGISPTLNTMSGGGREPKIAVMGNINPSGKGINGNVYSSEGISPTINTNKGERAKIAVREATKKGYSEATVGDSVNISQPNSKTRRGRVGHGIANTLTTAIEQATLTDDLKIRKLTPLECWRLQGFPDWAFDRAKQAGLSDSQLYKQAGNSVTVPVIKAIADRMKLEVEK